MATHPTNNPPKLPSLPTEILLDIFTAGLKHPDACALSLLCPEWALCPHGHHHHNNNNTPPTPNQTKLLALQSLLRSTRVDTYTLPAEGKDHGGTATTSFDHATDPRAAAHFWLPQMDDPRHSHGRDAVLPAGWVRAELTRRWVDGEGTAVVALPPVVTERYATELERVEGRLLPFWDDVVDVREGRVRRVTGVDGWEKEGGESSAGGEPRYWYKRLRGLVVTAEGLGAEMSRGMRRLDGNDVMANLRVRWSEMARLEVLCLDLRCVTGTGLLMPRPNEVARLARELQGRGLALLVVAGLRSREWYPGGHALDVAEVEGGTWDDESRLWYMSGGIGVNWWKVFMKAVRPGGRLVLVDKEDAGELSLLQPDAHHRAMLGL